MPSLSEICFKENCFISLVFVYHESTHNTHFHWTHNILDFFIPTIRNNLEFYKQCRKKIIINKTIVYK